MAPDIIYTLFFFKLHCVMCYHCEPSGYSGNLMTYYTVINWRFPQPDNHHIASGFSK